MFSLYLHISENHFHMIQNSFKSFFKIILFVSSLLLIVNCASHTKSVKYKAAPCPCSQNRR